MGVWNIWMLFLTVLYVCTKKRFVIIVYFNKEKHLFLINK
ncbi:hypothetical protein bcere0027_52220 [Bacillus cereus AH676]|nr:hypothetical protein bcere0027_52220 [Bacillus cereus AH676]